MLANAKPLWNALPDGSLKRQMLAELAQLGRMEALDLGGMWGAAAPRRATREAPPRRPPPRASQRVSRGTANLLDRALWLLIQRSDLWLDLDGQAHDLLAGQATPYDIFFGCLERSLHDHGPLAAAALLAELRTQAEQIGALPVVARIAEFHDPDPLSDLAEELAILLDRLRL